MISIVNYQFVSTFKVYFTNLLLANAKGYTYNDYISLLAEILLKKHIIMSMSGNSHQILKVKINKGCHNILKRFDHFN